MAITFNYPPGVLPAGGATSANQTSGAQTTAINDGVNQTVKATVAAFHNSDNQTFGGTAYGLFTGGVAQLKNILGNLDRQSETSTDNVPQLGISSGASQLASPYSTTSTGAIAISASAVVTPAAISGTINGSAYSIQVGSILIVDSGTNLETVLVTAVTATTFTAGFTKTHLSGTTILGFTYNQAKDATIGDNALPAGIASGAQYLLDAVGTYNRQRETSFDNIASAGIATGTQQVASPFSTSSTSTLTASATAQTVTPAVMSGLVSGSPFSIQQGQTLLIDSGVNQEKVQVLSVTTTTFTAVFTKAHGPTSFPISGYVYNQAKDSTIADGSVLSGIPASGTFLFNNALNGGAGGVERERSAAGEQDNASGSGTAVAAEYEFNGVTFDRARNLMGKGLGSTTSTTTTTASATTSITLAAAPTGLQSGSPVQLLDGANTETVYTTATYVAGSNPILIQQPTLFSHAAAITVQFDKATINGPGLNGFTATGIGIEEEAVFDPVTGLFYLERSATTDAMPPQNVVAESSAVWNGTTFDRMRSAVSDALATTGIAAEAEMLWNGTGFDRARSVAGDAMPQTGIGAENDLLFNGTTFDRARSASIANNVPATGIAAEAAYGQFNTVLPTLTTGNYAAAQLDSSGRLLVGSIAGALPAGANALGSISVSNFPTTQPVSGTVAVSNFPASQAVTGTFFQTTQPVSIAASVAVTGPLTDIQLRATPVPVSGTVSTGGLTDTQLRASAVPVSLTSTTVTNTVATTLASTTISSGTVTANIGTTNGLALDTSVNSLLKPASTLAAVTSVGTVSAVTAITNALPAGTNLLGSVKASGKSAANAPARNNYATTNVTTGAYVQLVASTTSAATEIEIFDSSGQTLALAFGAAASEVIQINIFPGGNGRIPLSIPAGTRVSIIAVSASATVGEININLYG